MRANLNQPAAKAASEANAQAAAAKGKKVSVAKHEAIRNAPQFKFPIAGGKGKASDKAAPAAKAAVPVAAAKGRAAKRKSA